MFASLSNEKALTFVAPDDRLQGVIAGKWATGLLDPTRNVAILAGGLFVGSIISRDGENGWLIVTDRALLAIGASKVTGAADHIFATAPRQTPVPLIGRKQNRLNVLNMDLVVKKADLPLAATLTGVAPGEAPPPVPLGFSPFQMGARPGVAAAPPPSPPAAAEAPAPAPVTPTARPPKNARTRGSTRWVPPPGTVPVADAPPPIGGLADLFKQPPAEPPAEA